MNRIILAVALLCGAVSPAAQNGRGDVFTRQTPAYPNVTPTIDSAVSGLVPDTVVAIVRLNPSASATTAGHGNSPWAIVLAPIDAEGESVRFIEFDRTRSPNDPAVDGELFEVILTLRGQWTRPPRYAIFAEWELTDSSQADAFITSRRTLFELRRRHIAEFAQDVLLRRVDRPNRFLVLGLYGSANALDAARGQPEIQRFVRDNPPTRWTARDVYGTRRFEVSP